MKKILALGLLVCFYFLDGAAQPASSLQQLMVKPKGQIVCYASGEDRPIYLAPPKHLALSNARTQTADFRVDYVGFPADGQAREAFQRAVDIWAGIIQSPVRINIRAAWVPQGASTLGSAIWGNVFANFDGAPKLNVFYPVALAEKLAGRPLNADPNPATAENYDIYAFFNSSQTQWDFSTLPVTGRYNFTTVVLHEIGHGLGFTDSYDITSGTGAYGVQGSGVPMIFDVGVENGADNSRLLDKPNNSSAMATFLTNANIRYNPVRSILQPPTVRPSLYAPNTWEGGSSIAHLDQITYTFTTTDRLMRPQLDRAQVTLDPGPIVLNMFSDMGWVAPYITHTPLKDTEVTNAPFNVSATVAPDGTSGYSLNSAVKIRYRINGGTEVEANMNQGTGNQYSFSLPQPTVVPSTYSYYLVVTDNYGSQNRVFTKPGQIIRPGQTDSQATFQFVAGPDITPPVISTTPLDFIFASTTSIEIKTRVTDNIGVQSVILDYQRNTGAFTTISLLQDNDTLSLYKGTIPTVGVVIGDVINYRIKATDVSSNSNFSFAPATGLYSVAVTGILPPQNSYQNDFNSSSIDFFGNGYSITTPSGFSNGAIHSAHPYPDGTGPNNESNFVYQLRIPIKIDGANPIITFDEIVLVEPGATGTQFGDPNFWDYVIVEGSTDNGSTWKRFLDGYDARANSDWLARWNASIVADNSTAQGDPSLYRSRSINMTANGNFKADDIVQIRFRLFADAGAHGWGWSIDNLKIQIDQSPPNVLHNHLNYSIGKSQPLVFNMTASDPSGLKSLSVEYKVNNGSTTNVPLTLQTGVSNYTLSLDISALSVGDVIQYRIKSSDNLDNTGVLPASGFLTVPIIAIGAPITQYASDFNSPNTDFVGNFFSVSTASGFNDGAINSAHPYSNGFGVNNSSSYTYTLVKPITVSATNPNIYFTEALVAEYSGNSVKDFAVIEGSKDNGQTWLPLLDSYSSNVFQEWRQAFDVKANANSSILKARLFDITKNGSFKAGDNILVRFRLFADAVNNGWGWAIDNLFIQSPITEVEKNIVEKTMSVYPNPAATETIFVSLETLTNDMVDMQVYALSGAEQVRVAAQPIDQKIEKEFNIAGWNPGLYFLKANVGGSIVTRKFVVLR
ncbi:MAG: T9SS type A sorting domain-containing protein [Bacteroidetes bacterium]|nr:T9SS type A sorting domain-containing protein [Bacteroidota bacterium]